ncbi:MAG: hypothetical protein ACFFBD_06125 [Candidatus Hodarchaeota archaeon]
MKDQEKSKNVIGVILTRIEDSGPEVVYNVSDLAEDVAMMLSIQSFTMIALGEGAPEGVYGPIPVPQMENLHALVYTFLTSGVDSEDIRVQEHGRQNGLFMVFPRDYLRYESQLIDSLKPYIQSYLAMGELTLERVHILRDLISSSVIFNFDIVSEYQNEIQRLKREIERLEKTIEELKKKKS